MLSPDARKRRLKNLAQAKWHHLTFDNPSLLMVQKLTNLTGRRLRLMGEKNRTTQCDHLVTDTGSGGTEVKTSE